MLNLCQGLGVPEHVLECSAGSESCSGRGQVFIAQVSPTPADPALPKIQADLGAPQAGMGESGLCPAHPQPAAGLEGTFQTIPSQPLQWAGNLQPQQVDLNP